MASEKWQQKATDLDLLGFVNGVSLTNQAHVRRLFEKFGVDGEDGDKIDQQVELLNFVRGYQAGALVVNKRQKKEVRMDKESLMQHIKNCQKAPQVAPRPAQIHSDEDKAIDLQSRQTTIQKFAEAICERRKSLSQTPMSQDRVKYPMPVFSGMKGLGKTRMLEEWPTAFQRAGITGASAAVIVTYGNGTGVSEEDGTLPIAASFGWRMLYQLFVKQNFKDEQSMTWTSYGFLPANAQDLDLPLALEVTRALLQEFGIMPPDSICSLFIGVDEYQAIPKGSAYEKKLQEAVTQVDTSQPLKDIRSTKFGILSIAGSSVPDTRRVPLSFLAPQGMEDAIRSGQNKERLANDQFRRELFFLGGLPRPSIAFANGCYTFDDIWDRYIDSEWNMTAKELLLLVAYAVSRKQVTQEDMPGIKCLKWYQLADQGLCLLEKGVVTIPYCIFRLAAAKADPVTLVEKCLVQNLKFLTEFVDKSLYVSEPWQQWEYFGAAFFALRVNSIILLDIANGDNVPIARLCEHAVTNCCHQIVDLRPMEVVRIAETISTNLPKTVTSLPSRQRINWVHGDTRGDTLGENVTYCVINGTSGEGVDIFCALRLSMSENFLLYADQRKRVATALGPVGANHLIQKAAIIPSCLGKDADYVLGLFSLLSSYNGDPDALFEDSFVLSYGQHKLFHGCLWSHPAASPCIDVNLDNISTLKLLKSVTSIAGEIIQRRPFQDLEVFSTFCAKSGSTLSVADQDRCIVYCGSTE